MKNLFRLRILFRIIGVIALASMPACTLDKTSLHVTRWSGEGDRPLIESKEIKVKPLPTWSSAQEEVQLSQQMIHQFPVEDSFIKTIRTKKKGIVFQSSALTHDISAYTLAQAQIMDEEKVTSWLLFMKKNPDFKDLKVSSLIEVVLVADPKLRPVLRVAVESKSGEMMNLTFNRKGQLLSSNRVGSNLAEQVDSPSMAYPRGPKKSQLTPILLSRKIQPEGLANLSLEVITESPNKILSTTDDFAFQITDERFDQVQAFYYSHAILNWFEKTLAVTGPIKLKIITHVGYPEKTNAAFYFRNQIRLGIGDDLTFSKIPWDPSVVMHETSHAIIDAIARLPFEGEGGSINEGFADVFTTFFLNSPQLADNSYRKADYKRSVEKVVKYSERDGGLYHDSAIVSSFFWELKDRIGKDKALRVALQVLNRLGPNSDFNDLTLSLREQSAVILNSEENKKVTQLITERDLP